MGCGCNKSKIERIFEGWKHVFWPDPQIEAIACRRAKICMECPKVKNVLGSYVCSLCGCPLTAKCRSLSEECGIGKWSKEKVTTNV